MNLVSIVAAKNIAGPLATNSLVPLSAAQIARLPNLSVDMTRRLSAMT